MMRYVNPDPARRNVHISCARKAWLRRRWSVSALKPCSGTQRVTNPARPRLATSRKRVLRGGEVTHAAERRQRVCRPCD